MTTHPEPRSPDEPLAGLREAAAMLLDELGSGGDGFQFYVRRLRAALAVTRPEPDLDAAWKAAEAALPDGWRINGLRLHDDDVWDAEVRLPYAESVRLRLDFLTGQGPTPAALAQYNAEVSRGITHEPWFVERMAIQQEYWREQQLAQPGVLVLPGQE